MEGKKSLKRIKKKSKKVLSSQDDLDLATGNNELTSKCVELENIKTNRIKTQIQHDLINNYHQALLAEVQDKKNEFSLETEKFGKKNRELNRKEKLISSASQRINYGLKLILQQIEEKNEKRLVDDEKNKEIDIENLQNELHIINNNSVNIGRDGILRREKIKRNKYEICKLAEEFGDKVVSDSVKFSQDRVGKVKELYKVKDVIKGHHLEESKNQLLIYLQDKYKAAGVLAKSFYDEANRQADGAGGVLKIEIAAISEKMNRGEKEINELNIHSKELNKMFLRTQKSRKEDEKLHKSLIHLSELLKFNQLKEKNLKYKLESIDKQDKIISINYSKEQGLYESVSAMSRSGNSNLNWGLGMKYEINKEYQYEDVQNTNGYLIESNFNLVKDSYSLPNRIFRVKKAKEYSIWKQMKEYDNNLIVWENYLAEKEIYPHKWIFNNTDLDFRKS